MDEVRWLPRVPINTEHNINKKGLGCSFKQSKQNGKEKFVLNENGLEGEDGY